MRHNYELQDAWDNSEEYPEEINFLMDIEKVSRKDIVISNDNIFGEEMIYIKGRFYGYVDEAFYLEMKARDIVVANPNQTFEEFYSVFKEQEDPCGDYIYEAMAEYFWEKYSG